MKIQVDGEGSNTDIVQMQLRREWTKQFLNKQVNEDHNFFAVVLKLDEYWFIFLGMSSAGERGAIFFVTINILCILVGVFVGLVFFLNMS